jgi:hypothetical protein
MRGLRCLIGRHDWVVPDGSHSATDMQRTCSRCDATISIALHRSAPMSDQPLGPGEVGGGSL